jgi:hypothetical protein
MNQPASRRIAFMYTVGQMLMVSRLFIQDLWTHHCPELIAKLRQQEGCSTPQLRTFTFPLLSRHTTKRTAALFSQTLMLDQ